MYSRLELEAVVLQASKRLNYPWILATSAFQINRLNVEHMGQDCSRLSMMSMKEAHLALNESVCCFPLNEESPGLYRAFNCSVKAVVLNMSKYVDTGILRIFIDSGLPLHSSKDCFPYSYPLVISLSDVAPQLAQPSPAESYDTFSELSRSVH